ncbi:MAG: tetratricopeptide repeat protein [Thermoplasmata archaeon]|nr:tetratricopeptide repeat protein [Thermoplasmata archaeon]
MEFKRGNLDAAISHFNEITRLHGDEPDMINIHLEAFQLLMKCYEIQGEYDLLFSSYRNLRSLSNLIDDRALLAETHKRSGAMWWRMGFHHSALEEYSIGREMAEDLSDPGLIAGIVLGMGLSHSELGEYQKADDEFNEVLNILGDMKMTWRDKQNLVGCHNNLGMNFEYQGRYGEAKEEFLKAVELGRRENNAAQEEFGLVNLARAEVLLGNFDSAKENLERAELLDHDVNSEELLGGIYLVKALASLHDEDMETAGKNYDKANRLLKDKLGSAGNGTVAYVWGSSLQHLGFEEEAKEYLEEASECFWDVGNETRALEAEKLLSACTR